MEEIKTYKIIWSPSFKKELSNMLYYISNILQYPKIARKTLNLIDSQKNEIYILHIFHGNQNYFI